MKFAEKGRMIMSSIGFSYKPSIAYLSIENMELSWIQELDKEHAIFQQLSSVDAFDYYFIQDILVIPDPIPVVRNNWNRNINIIKLEIECNGSFLVFFKFNEVKDGIILANSLTLPQYEFLKNSIRLG